MELKRDFDCIVIGAGIIGSSSAYQLAKKGLNTLLLEQFDIPHGKGSSGGHSRVIRLAHADISMTALMKESFQLWHQLEQESGVQLYKKTGMLLISSSSAQQVSHDYAKSDAHFDIVRETLSNQDLQQRFKGFRYKNSPQATYYPQAGTLRASKALRCYQAQFVKYGGVLHDSEKVMQIIPGSRITVKTTRGTYWTKRLIIASGPWASDLLQEVGIKLPLTIDHINVCYWKEKTPGIYSKVFCDVSSTLVYGLPADEYPGHVKVCVHHGDKQQIPHLNDRDEPCSVNDEDIRTISKYIKEHLPGLEDKPSIVEHCLYTNSPDSVPIIDRHPVFPNIVFACGMSGEGFKFAPIFGKILSQLVLGDKVQYSLQAFRHDRFASNEATVSKL